MYEIRVVTLYVVRTTVSYTQLFIEGAIEAAPYVQNLIRDEPLGKSLIIFYT